MLQIILGLIPIKGKLLVGGIILIAGTILIGIYRSQANTIKDLKKDNQILQLEITYKETFYEDELFRTRTNIQNLTDSIKQFKTDKEAAEKKIVAGERKLVAQNTTRQQNITTDLNKNDSPENQMKIITDMLKGFSDETL